MKTISRPYAFSFFLASQLILKEFGESLETEAT